MAFPREPARPSGQIGLGHALLEPGGLDQPADPLTIRAVHAPHHGTNYTTLACPFV